MAAAVKGGKASRPRMAEMKRHQMVSGILRSDIPTARMLMMVVTKLRPPIVNETMKSATAKSQSVCPHPDPGTA